MGTVRNKESWRNGQVARVGSIRGLPVNNRGPMCLTQPAASLPPFNPLCVSALLAFGFLVDFHMDLGLAFLFPEFSFVASVVSGGRWGGDGAERLEQWEEKKQWGARGDFACNYLV